MVKPAVVRLFRERGIEVHEVHRGVSAERHGEAIEVDLMVVNETEVVAVECKNKLSVDDIDEHLARLARLRRLLPRYREARVMGAVAAMVLPDDVARYAYRKGLFVLAQSGDSVIIRNDARFVPAVW
jgi:RecB family endonuclease NucS